MVERAAVKYCRYCGNVIFLGAEHCPYCGRNVIKGAEEKLCPFCRERIKAGATKCKHCGEFLDGRPSGEQSRGQVYIEKAIIAAGRGDEEVEIYRADGTRIDPDQLPPAGELPERRPAGLLEGETRAGVPARTEPHGAPAAAEPEKEPPQTAPAEPPPPRPGGPTQEARLECPICGRTVFESDNYCENCGRDLSLQEGETSLPPRPREFPLADYALIAATLAPAAFLLPGPLKGILAAAGVILGAVTAFGAASGPRWEGAGKGIGALVVGAIWLALLAL